MRVLIGCESSGIVRDAFLARGHHAISCDLEPTERVGNHIRGDVLTVLNGDWDLMIVFPPCTHLAVSGALRFAGKEREQSEALEFIRVLLDAPIPRIALENPVGIISTRIRPASQYIRPYQFGDNASKKTGLWLKNLPPLMPTRYVLPRFVAGKPRWANQTDSGQNKLGPSPTRARDRARTYQGIADAMADQWGGL